MKNNVSHGGTKAQRGDFESLVADITELAATLNQLHKQMVTECVPIVQDIVRSRCRDQQQIEHTLDRLLDCACIPEGLALFKSLCRYYYSLNPAATADYVFAYRDMWDSEEKDEALTEAQRRGGEGDSPRRTRRARREEISVPLCLCEKQGLR
jgi:hypothetical protein